MRFEMSIELGNAAVPLDEKTGGWTYQTLMGIAETISRHLGKMIVSDSVDEHILDINGNVVGTARFVKDQE